MLEFISTAVIARGRGLRCGIPSVDARGVLLPELLVCTLF